MGYDMYMVSEEGGDEFEGEYFRANIWGHADTTRSNEGCQHS